MIGRNFLRFSIRALIVLGLGLRAGQPYSLAAQAPQSPVLRDGQHDFDFNIGVWHTHIRRVPDPFSAPDKSVELNGTVTVRKLWGGRGQLEEIEGDGPNGHWEGLTTFLYNPQSHQWNQAFIDSTEAVSSAPLIGSFHDGRGEFFLQETFQGKAVLLRGLWSDIKSDSHHFEEAYSRDGGATWHPTFIAELYREKAASTSDIAAGAAEISSSPDSDDPQHGFDFDIGTWKTHSSRLVAPLTGSTKWVELDGISVVKKVWGGRANVAEYKAQGPAGTVELMALRWFNPATKEWNINFATPGVGTLGVPGVGEFKNGRCTFYDYELIGGRSVLVRFAIWKINGDAAQSEQAFSVDGGKTWEVNWVNKYTRVAEKL